MEMGAQFPTVRPVANLVTALAVRCMHLCTRRDGMNLPRVTLSQHVFSLQGEKKTLYCGQEWLSSDKNSSAVKCVFETEEKRGNQP